MSARILLGTVVAAGAVLCGCGSPAGLPGRHSATSDAARVGVSQSAPGEATGSSRDPVEIHIVLDGTTVRAGRPIRGVAIVTNATAHPLVIADCHGSWLQVGLTSAKISYDPAWLGCLSVPGTTLPVGTTQVPINVLTTYGRCSEHARFATAGVPVCLHGSDGPTMPSLPPGTYVTKAVMLQPKGVQVPTPPRLQVTLTS